MDLQIAKSTKALISIPPQKSKRSFFVKVRAFTKLIACLSLTLLFSPFVAADGGPPVPKTESRLKNRTPQEAAIAYYNKGISLRDDAWDFEKKAEESPLERDQDKYLKKAKKAFTRAVKQFTMAIKKDPKLFQAHSSLGYALRKTGDYEASLEAYNTALKINPTYTEAVEYRAEAHLGLNRLEEAKQAYMVLFKHDRPRADKLLVAMKNWIDDHQEDPGEAGREKVNQLSEWVKQRDEIAKQTGTKGGNGTW